MQYGENCASEADFGGRNMGMGGSSASYGNAKLVDAPTPEVLACVENLGREVKEMQEIVGLLFARLAPLMREETIGAEKEGNPKTHPPTKSRLSNDIDSQALKIRQTVFHIESVLSRLGL